jgi:DNA adenine methylase
MSKNQTLAELKAECKKRSIALPSRATKSDILTLLGYSVAQPSVDCLKPTIKWVGGKSQLLGKILSRFPSQISSYYEPFLGGGSVLLGLLSSVKAGRIQCERFYASDTNSTLIQYYNHLKDSPVQLADAIDQLFETFSLQEKKPDYYNLIRKEFNEKAGSAIEQSARFHFLNKTCYRGLYRVNSKGGFNTPYEKSKSTQNLRLDRDHLLAVSELIQPVEFTVQSFRAINPQPGDFVYLDPPYVAVAKDSFDSYSSGGFEFHDQLFEQVHQFKEKGIGFLMSNSNTEKVTDAFQGYTIEQVECKRRIHSSNPSSMETEVLVSP